MQAADVVLTRNRDGNNTGLVEALTRAPLGYSAERAPLGGGGHILPPCLTPELHPFPAKYR